MNFTNWKLQDDGSYWECLASLSLISSNEVIIDDNSLTVPFLMVRIVKDINERWSPVVRACTMREAYPFTPIVVDSNPITSEESTKKKAIQLALSFVRNQ